jgi:hypothetical protein
MAEPTLFQNVPCVKGVNLIGLTFGRLTVFDQLQTIKPGEKRWHCRCECGNVRIVSGGHLKSGHTQSCGCWRRDINSLVHRKHGMRHTPEFETWAGMRQRCGNPNDADYKNYGARGITICDRWSSFECFLEDMGVKPSPKHSIDRRDNNGNYEPGNCFWATKKQQSRNTRRNRFYTMNGETLCIADWAERAGVDQVFLAGRLDRGWDIRRAVLTPVKKRGA